MRRFSMTTMANEMVTIKMMLDIDPRSLKRSRFQIEWRPYEPDVKSPQVSEELLLLRHRLIQEAAEECGNTKILEL